MNTPLRRKASAAYFKRREEAGQRRVTVWLTPEARDALDRLGARMGSKDMAVQAALLVLDAESE